MKTVNRRALVDEHMGLVRGIAAKIHRTVREHVELDELISLGSTGLLEAADRYDPNLGTPFAAFAHYRIRGAIFDGLRKMAQVPRGQYRKILAARQASAYLDNLEQRSAALRAPGRGTAAKNRVEQVRELADAMRSVAAIYVVAVAPDDLDASRCADGARVDEIVEKRTLVAQLGRAIASLPEREQHLIRRCYFDGVSLREAGEELGLSRSWSSRLHARAVERLRVLLDDEPL